MITVRIFEVRLGEYTVTRKAEIAEKMLEELSTHIYKNGGVELEENYFQVQSPLLVPIVKELEEMLHIKFVEEKPKRVQ